MTASIVIVEDEVPIQELLALNLERAGHEVIRLSDAESALRVVANVLPDMMLIDWMLPQMSGVALTRRLRQEARTKALPIIMLTGRAQEEDKITAFEAGADDYMTKPFSPRELLVRVKALLRRRTPQATEDVVAYGGLSLDPATHRVFANSTPVGLGPTEFRLLHYLMVHPERVHSRGQVLNQIWGDHVFVEERTVDVHVRRIRKALEPTGHDKLIETVRGTGYRFAPTPGGAKPMTAG